MVDLWLWWHRRKSKKYGDEVFRRSYQMSSALVPGFGDKYRDAWSFFTGAKAPELAEVYAGLAISVRSLDMNGFESRDVFLAMMEDKGTLSRGAHADLARMPIEDLRRLLIALESL